MEENKSTWKKLVDYLRPAMAFRSKPGCTTCLTPILDNDGKPVIPSQTSGKTGS